MKKQVFFIFCSMLFYSASAQTYFMNQTFQATTMPSGWTQTTSATDGGWIIGTSTSIQTIDFPVPSHSRFIATSDDKCNCNKSADRLISPTIDLSTAAFAFLSLDSYTKGSGEITTIMVSINGGSTWTTTDTIPFRVDSWRTTIFNLSSYIAGQSNVKIAINYNDKGVWAYGCAIDNVKLYEPLAYDIKTTTVKVNTFVDYTPQTIKGTLENLGGTTITSLKINYSVDGGSTVSENVTGASLEPSNVYNYTCTNPWIPTSPGKHSVKVWMSDLNGNADQLASNDTAYTTAVASPNLVQRKELWEGFTSSTCNPCAYFNSYIVPMLNSYNVNKPNGKIVAVKYQMNYPSPGNDPAYTSECFTRHDYYGITGISYDVIDGNVYSGNPAPLINDYLGGGTTVIDERYNDPSAYSISLTPIYNGNQVTVTGTVTSKADVNLVGGTVKLFVALVENLVTSSDGGHGVQSNAETSWDYVFRKMLPNTNGTLLTSQVDGTINNVNLTYTFTNFPKLFTSTANMTCVAWVQNTTTGEVYQAYSTALELVGIEENNNIISMLDVYPNPVNSSNQAFVSFKLKHEETVSFSIVNLLGETIANYTMDKIPAGVVNLPLDISTISGGIYIVNVSAGEYKASKKLVLER